MIRSFLRSRIEGGRVTSVNRALDASIAIDAHIMNAAGLFPFERVQVDNLTRGERFDSYVTEAEAGSGTIAINGGGGSRAQIGDAIVIVSFGSLHQGQIETHRPRLVVVDSANRLNLLEEAGTSPSTQA
ncbi:MAG TPA: aspartate 1-decarboxylase [Thermoanaerobaculia bacterium]|nr:aspartate 1-decarboxylase [Thermoanaerobaculia bacterium]